MTIPLDHPALSKLLASAAGPADLVGADGRVLGTFLPRPPIDIKSLKPGISEEELRRRAADTSTQGYTGEQVMAHLRSLPCTD